MLNNNQKILTEIQAIESSQKNTEKLIKELLRKNDRLSKSVQMVASMEKGEDALIEDIGKTMPYISVNPVGKGGINYSFLISSKDKVMTKKMFGGYKGIQSEDELQTFFDLSQKYYGVKPDRGYFVDIGGNIGTTSVVVKKTKPKMNVIAFEPGRDNNRVFKANCALNDVQVEIIQKGLGEKAQESKLSLSSDNMGNHRIANEYTDGHTEDIMVSTFDEELSRITDDIDYVWMDVEGYEGHVLAGMRQSLEKKKFPIWMEFCPKMLKESGGLQKLYDILPQFFDRFIDRHAVDKEADINTLKSVADSLGYDGKATDLFLIRRGG